MTTLWWCEDCGAYSRDAERCRLCGQPEPPAPLLGAEVKLQFTGIRIPKEE